MGKRLRVRHFQGEQTFDGIQAVLGTDQLAGPHGNNLEYLAEIELAAYLGESLLQQLDLRFLVAQDAVEIDNIRILRSICRQLCLALSKP